jgi:saccharopine dehydrogenase-like NADP-dependent oxidoreductase
VRISLVGVGATGARAARQLATSDQVDRLVLADADPTAVRSVRKAIGERVEVVDTAEAFVDTDVTVLAVPSPAQPALAAEAIRAGSDVVSLADGLADVRALMDRGDEAAERGRTLLIGAGFAPGLTCILARHAAAWFDTVEEIHVAKLGTGGPSCALEHHDALAGRTLDWRGGGWREQAGGSGRGLSWFPEPVGGADCYRAALPDPMLLHASFPGADRITARMAATRRDRFTARLPMLRRPHPEGLIGAVRVEVRGRVDGRYDTHVLGVLDRPAVAAGAVAAVAALRLGNGQLGLGPGGHGLGAIGDPTGFLHQLAERGVRAAAFGGTAVSA